MITNKTNKTNKNNTVEDITMKLLNDSRITGKHIELYNLVTNDFKNNKSAIDEFNNTSIDVLVVGNKIYQK